MKRVFVLQLALVLAFGFAACGGNGDGDGDGPMSVAIFINDNYVDYIEDPMGDEGYEGYNVLYHLQDEGLSYTAFSGVASTDFAAALEGRDALIIPETENGDLLPDLNDAAQSVIGDFVDGGGTLIGMWHSYGLSDIVNAIFGYSMETASIEEPISYNAADAAGTRFEGGPATLIDADATDSLLTSTLPVGAMSMYLDSAGNSVVTLIEEGDGEIILLGYDWYDAAPAFSQDGGWVEILNRALDNY
ncbi:MAG: hypothetical protein JXR72_00375 [Proteobacteria bacterium]|nr:hypothetical protein [Pseudomonadota bacterium]